MTYVADSSAVLALFQNEPVSIDLSAALARATISAVNLCEVATKLIDAGQTPTAARLLIAALDMPTVAFDETLASASAALRRATRDAGLSLGDRCCLALAAKLGMPALTGDRVWATLADAVGCEIVLIR